MANSKSSLRATKSSATCVGDVPDLLSEPISGLSPRAEACRSVAGHTFAEDATRIVAAAAETETRRNARRSLIDEAVKERSIAYDPARGRVVFRSDQLRPPCGHPGHELRDLEFLSVTKFAAIDEALSAPGGQSMALEALGVPLEKLDEQYQGIARELLPVLQLASEGYVARDSRRWVEALLEAVRNSIEQRRVDRNRRWMLVLEREMTHLDMEHPERRELSSAALAGLADAIVEGLRSEVGNDLPKHFSSDNVIDRRKKLKAAAIVLKEARITLGKPGGRGRLLSPWGAAREFGKAFGLEMPERSSELARDFSKASGGRKRSGRA